MSTPLTPPSRRVRQVPATPKEPSTGAGRNLPVAIGVGVVLGAVVIASLVFDRRGFVALATVASVVGCIELIRAMNTGRVTPPIVPVVGAGVVVPIAAYVWGPVAVLPALVGSVLAVVLWSAASEDGRAMPRDAAAGALIVLYLPAMVAFAILLIRPADGVARIVVFVLVTIASDIGGYFAGTSLGKHPMAPTVSPKKSWEGFAGSALACVVVGVVTVMLALKGAWWVGVVLGLCVVVAATVGDLCESMIKRDLGIKDMSNLIPGHGGLMDRLDSLALAAPVTWAVLTFVGS